ncbi:hypothetical protein, partial [Phormidium sp. FACHB-322]
MKRSKICPTCAGQLPLSYVIPITYECASKWKVLLALEEKGMGRPFIVEIAESEAQLKKTLQQARSASQ